MFVKVGAKMGTGEEWSKEDARRVPGVLTLPLSQGFVPQPLPQAVPLLVILSSAEGTLCCHPNINPAPALNHKLKSLGARTEAHRYGQWGKM